MHHIITEPRKETPCFVVGASEQASIKARRLDAGVAVAEAAGALGNLLGGEQSGHIAGVGFDLYLRMVGEAVADFKGEEDTSPAEVKVELPVNAHLPHDYVPGERLRIVNRHRHGLLISQGRELEGCSESRGFPFSNKHFPVLISTSADSSIVE